MGNWRVIYYVSPSGSNPVSDFLDGLLSVIPHIKKLTGTPLWEIRVLGKHNARIIYIVPAEKSVLLLHGFMKKTDKTPLKEIRIALERFKDLTR